jgi:precorrin-6Y C5,15-methyltransferase (decarboxylating)
MSEMGGEPQAGWEMKVWVIGVGNDGRPGLSETALGLIEKADLLIGGERLLAFFPESTAEKLAIKSNMDEVAERVRAGYGHRRIVVLGTGDPNFYGITKTLTARLPREWFELLPTVSAMQWAFAKIKEPWDDAVLISVHGRRPLEPLIELVRGSGKVGVFTDEVHSPPAIARTLLAQGITDVRAYVCEDLQSEREKVTETDLETLARMTVSPLNTLILIRKGGGPKAGREMKNGEGGGNG